MGKEPQPARRRRSAEEVRFWLELRRSSAAQPHRNKARYSRKAKHPGRGPDRDAGAPGRF